MTSFSTIVMCIELLFRTLLFIWVYGNMFPNEPFSKGTVNS